jgi:hypothetical protein
MNSTYKKIDFLYIDIGLVVTDSYGSSCSGLYMIYATSNNQIIGYILSNQKPSYPSLNLLKLQIPENIKDIKKWMINPYSYNPIFKTSPFISRARDSYLRTAKSIKYLNMMLKVGSDEFLDVILDIPSEYLSPLLRVWLFTPQLALQLVHDQMKRNSCLIAEGVKPEKLC